MNNVNELASKRTVIETFELVKESPSSIFTKEDVMKLLAAISIEPETLYLNREAVDRLLELIDFNIRDVDVISAIDKSTAEFSLDGNTIELDSVEIDSSYIFDEVERAVEDWYKDIRLN